MAWRSSPHTRAGSARVSRKAAMQNRAILRFYPRCKIAGRLWLRSYAALALHTLMCKDIHMATNLALDDNLIEEARRAGSHKTKKEAVTAALAEYVKRRKQLRILEAFGSIDFDPKYDYKAERRRTRS